MPAASAFGPMKTRVRPTSRGRARCVSFRMGRRWEQTADGPRAGAVRLRRGYAGDRAVGAAVPPDRAVGSLLTRVRPTSRGRARCVSFRRGAAVGDDGERPTSRGRSPAARWATLPCPAGQGTLPGCGGDAVCPAGKGAAEWRAGSLAYHGGKQGIKAFSPSGEFTGAPGSGAVARCPASDGDARPPANGARPSPDQPPFASSPRGKRGALQARLTAIAFSRRTYGACTQHRLPSPVKSQRFALPAAASSSKPSRRETGGLCPHPPKGPVPWESLLGNQLPSPRPPKTPQAAGPCSWACRRLFPPLPQPNRNAAPKPPARGAWVRRPGAEGAGRRHCRPSRRGRLRRLGRSRRSGRRGRARCARSGRRRAALP